MRTTTATCPQVGYLQQCRCQKGRRCDQLAESFPETYRSVLAPSRLSSNRAWKTTPGCCDIHDIYRPYNGLTRYSSLVSSVQKITASSRGLIGRQDSESMASAIVAEGRRSASIMGFYESLLYWMLLKQLYWRSVVVCSARY